MRLTPAVLAVALCLSAAPLPAARAPQLWGSLQPGPYAVGVRSLLEEDPSRSWSDPQSVETTWWPRPIRMLLWYPAAKGSAPGTFRQYVTTPPSRYPRSIAGIFAEHDLGRGPLGRGLAGFVGGDAAALEALLNAPVAGSPNARPAAGRFPLVLYSLGQNNILQENVVLAELLASNGYVVITPAELGTNSRRRFLLIHDPASYEEQVRDLEFALVRAAREPFVDRDAIVAVGHSMGGEYALLLAMRNPRIRALAGLDPSFIAAAQPIKLKLPRLPFFDSAAVRLPLLIESRQREEESSELVDSLRFADVTWIRYAHASHGDFNSGAMIQRHLPDAMQNQEDLKSRTPEQAARVFETSSRNLLHFLGAALQQKPFVPLVAPDVEMTVITRAAATALDEEMLQRLVETRGVDAALAAVGNAAVEEATIERIANELSWTGREAQSKRMFELLERLRKR
jgi:dienelactone hydrolase